MTLLEKIENRMRERPEEPAIMSWPGEVVSNSEWWERSRRLASLLPDSGGFLAFQSNRDAELPYALLAAWMRGVAVLPLPTNLTDRERDSIFAQCGLPSAIWRNLPEGHGAGFSMSAPDPARLALLLCTSGTTSAPKVFGFSHRELMDSATIEQKQFPQAQRKRVLNLRPSFTSGGTNTIWPVMNEGGVLCYAEDSFRLPRKEAMAGLLEKIRPSLVVASLSFLRAYIADPAELTASIERLPLFYGGGALRPAEHVALRAEGFLPFMRYGMTECAHILSVRDFSESSELGADQFVGRPYEGVEVQVGQGRLSFRAPGFASCRFEGGHAVPCLVGGWYPSDDLGALTDKGIFLEGREHRQIVIAGFRVSPAEIEECLLESGWLADCAVVGVPDSLWGERAAALVVPTVELADPNLLLDYCRKRLSPQKVPISILLVESIPVLSSGKRDWVTIRNLLTPKVGD